MEGLKLWLCGNCTLRDGWLSPRFSCRGQAADWLQGDDTHANAVPPAQTPRARKQTPGESRGEPHGWPEKCIRHLLRAELIKQQSFPFFEILNKCKKIEWLCWLPALFLQISFDQIRTNFMRTEENIILTR